MLLVDETTEKPAPPPNPKVRNVTASCPSPDRLTTARLSPARRGIGPFQGLQRLRERRGSPRVPADGSLWSISKRPRATIMCSLGEKRESLGCAACLVARLTRASCNARDAVNAGGRPLVGRGHASGVMPRRVVARGRAGDRAARRLRLACAFALDERRVLLSGVRCSIRGFGCRPQLAVPEAARGRAAALVSGAS